MRNGNFFMHGGGEELNLSSSRKYALGRLGRGIPLAPKNYYSLGVGLTLYKSIGCNVRLSASAKVRDTQYCKLGGQGLKKLLCPLGANIYIQKEVGRKTGMWGRGLDQNT